MDYIKFSQNWNGKLHCKFFTTIRLAQSQRFFIGKMVDIFLKEQRLFDANIVSVIECLIDDLPEEICYINTGYNKQATVELMKKIYSAKNIDWSNQKLHIIFLENLNWKQ
ncbi:MAG: hypothetical protein NTZ59_02295 [Bacteroidetes bacterium]|nr:hypothetical protein [Bacteroidota bacterium]